MGQHIRPCIHIDAAQIHVGLHTVRGQGGNLVASQSYRNGAAQCAFDRLRPPPLHEAQQASDRGSDVVAAFGDGLKPRNRRRNPCIQCIDPASFTGGALLFDKGGDVFRIFDLFAL